jgi:chemotaxis protein methyltransferase CheR
LKIIPKTSHWKKILEEINLIESKTSHHIEKIISEIKKKTGKNIQDFKPVFLERRIQYRMRILNITELGEYVELLSNSWNEAQSLYGSFSINVTKFFRDPQVWEKLEKETIPNLIAKSKSSRIKVWSCGSASGEEPHSISIMLDKLLKGSGKDYGIYANDINHDALIRAQKAEYRNANLVNVSNLIINNYFEKISEKFYKVKLNIRNKIQYEEMDLMKTSGRMFDIIFCRNVLIYYDKNSQEDIYRKFSELLRDGGILVLGQDESMIGTKGKEFFELLDPKERIYQKISQSIN